MSRKNKNWLKSFYDWTKPRSEATDILLFWSGIFCLSSVLKRKVWIPGEGMLGGWICYPNIYILFIGEQGVVKKSTTMDKAEILLKDIPDITYAKSITTQAGLMEDWTGSKDGSMCIVADEFASLVMKSKQDMYDFLTQAFNCKPTITAKTVMRGEETVVNPCMNMIAAITPLKVKAVMSPDMIGGGFASRTMLIYETEVGQRVMYPGRRKEAMTDLDKQMDLVADLIEISRDVRGSFTIEEQAMDWMEDYYQTKMKNNNPLLNGFYARKPEYIHKIAMLTHIAQDDKMQEKGLTIDQEDLQAGITIMDQVEKRMPPFFRLLGKNPYSLDMESILGFIQEKKTVAQREVLAHFYHSAQPEILKNLVLGLVQMGAVDAVMKGEEVYLMSKENSNGKAS